MQENSVNTTKDILILILVAIVLSILSIVGSTGGVRNVVSYIYTPVSLEAYRSGINTSRYFSVFKSIVEIKNENEDLKAKNTELESKLAQTESILVENSELRKLKLIEESTVKLVKGNMFLDLNNLQTAYLNIGSNLDVHKGDIVQYLNVYAGTVISTDSQSSIVKLPYSTTSFLKVVIIKKIDTEGKSNLEIDKDLKKLKRADAVAIGKGNKVVLENIKSDSGIVQGDTVIINDERIGRHLILGTVGEIERDLAAASVTGTVDLLIDYSSLYNYFIAIND